EGGLFDGGGCPPQKNPPPCLTRLQICAVRRPRSPPYQTVCGLPASLDDLIFAASGTPGISLAALTAANKTPAMPDAPANLRRPAASVAPIPNGMRAPCVLGRLDFRRLRHAGHFISGVKPTLRFHLTSKGHRDQRR